VEKVDAARYGKGWEARIGGKKSYGGKKRKRIVDAKKKKNHLGKKVVPSAKLTGELQIKG